MMRPRCGRVLQHATALRGPRGTFPWSPVMERAQTAERAAVPEMPGSYLRSGDPNFVSGRCQLTL